MAGLVTLNGFWVGDTAGCYFFFFSASSWTTASEPLFYKWNVPQQNSIKWLPQLENWELLQRLKHQGSESFSPTLREFQIREWVLSVTRDRKRLQRVPLYVDSSVGEQTYTKGSADSRRDISCFTLDNSKFSRGRVKGEIKTKNKKNAKHDAENIPGIRAH